MTTLQQLCERTPMMLFDGGMGTLLQERGLEAGEVGERWNLERPAAIRQIHAEYADAGATILTTNTFGGSRPRLELGGLGEQVIEVNRAAAAIASEVARERGILVAGDLGPTGELLEPLGTLTRDGAEEVFAEQLTGLVAGGIDLVVIETMSDLDEVLAAITAAKAVSPDLPVIATLSFDTNLRTMMGVSPTAAVTALATAGVDAIGANCGRGPSDMETIAAELAAARPAGMLLAAQSNAGLPHAVGDHFEYDKTPADMAAHAIELHRLGIDLIGACCGSTPGHIKAMHAALSAA